MGSGGTHCDVCRKRNDNCECPYPADAVVVKGKRLKWQCGCRQNGGVLATVSKFSDPDIDELIDAARAVIEVYREPVGNLNRRSDFTNVVKRLIDLVG